MRKIILSYVATRVGKKILPRVIPQAALFFVVWEGLKLRKKLKKK